jgi:hypothetical protein
MRTQASPDTIHASVETPARHSAERHLLSPISVGDSGSHAVALLEPLRFGEYLRERNLISDEQLLAALAAHWSDRRWSIGRTLVEQGILPLDLVEAEARTYHHDLDVVEIDAQHPAPTWDAFDSDR